MKRALPHLVFLLLLTGIVAFVLATVDRGPLERGLMGNELTYWTTASQRATSTTPVYARLLAPLSGSEPGAVAVARRTLTALLLPLFALLVYLLAARRAGEWAALLAGGGAALVAPSVLAAGALGPSFPASLLGLTALLVLDGRRTVFSWIAGGALVGAATVLLPLLGWCLLILLAVLAYRSPGRPRRAPAMALLAGSWLLAAMLGHGATAGAFSPPPVNGLEIHRGHAAPASGLEPSRHVTDPRRWWGAADYLREASLAENRKLGSRGASTYWLRRAVSDMVKSPLQELRRTGVKLLATLQGDPLPQGVSAAFLLDRTEKPGLAVSVWVGRLLLPLGLVGLVMARRRAGGVVWVALGSGLLAALLTYADADTRLLTVAALLVGTALWIGVLRAAPWRSRAVTLGASAAAFLVCGLWPAHGGVPDQGITGFDYYYLGSVYDTEGRGSAALREYDRSLRLDPRNPYTRFSIATMLARDNVNAEAIKELERLRESHPRFIPGLTALAHLYERQEQWGNAVPVYNELMALDPWNAEYPNNLGTNLAQLGYFDQAGAALERALSVDPKYETARANLQSLRERGLVTGEITGENPIQDAQHEIILFLRGGDFPGARAALDSAYARFGTEVWGFRFLEGSYYLTSGDPVRAIEIFEAIGTGHENDIAYLHNLATAHAQIGTRNGRIGDLEKARDLWKQALTIQPSNEPVRHSLETLEATIDSIRGSG